MSRYLRDLEKTGMSLIIYKDGDVIFESRSQGIRPHLEAIEKLGNETLRGTVMADRIVGRAAALLILYSGAAEVHALIVSSGGRDLLESRGVSLTFGEETPFIKMRNGVIFCPFERMVQGISDPEEAYQRIKSEFSKM